MTVEQFFNLFLQELQQHPELRKYYKFLEGGPQQMAFRKAYFCKRLQYILDHVGSTDQRIWDCGCGYATTQFFLAMNGYKTIGTTLEFYYAEIPKRLAYWQQFGDTSLLEVKFEDVLECSFADGSYDLIIIQDTLHHLEPLQQCLAVFNRVLANGGQLLVIEENGNNVIQNAKLYLRRGNKRIIEVYDEKLGRTFLMGNENIRSYRSWKAALKQAGLHTLDEQVEYIRLFPPLGYKLLGTDKVAQHEQKLWKQVSFLREYFYFGINYMARKA